MNEDRYTQAPQVEVCWGGLGRFPDEVHVIKADDCEAYAANNATLPDGKSFDGLACFPSLADATKYLELPDVKKVFGEISACSFSRAREIAKSKPKLDGLLLFVNGRIVEYHFVR